MSNTRATVHKAIDNAAIAAFVTAGVCPLIQGNMLNTDLSKGQVSYVRVNVRFPVTGQRELGNSASSRTHGAVVFTLYVRKGKGNGDRNALSQVALNAFRNKQFGGATFFGSQELPDKETENWCLSGMQIPFYFDEV